MKNQLVIVILVGVIGLLFGWTVRDELCDPVIHVDTLTIYDTVEILIPYNEACVVEKITDKWCSDPDSLTTVILCKNGRIDTVTVPYRNCYEKFGAHTNHYTD